VGAILPQGVVQRFLKFDGGTTKVDQKVGATDSSLTLTNDKTANTNNSGNYLVTINQNGSYQNATVDYVNGGYNGTLNLDAHGATGTPATYATVDVKM
jgi:hypothetical protein